MSPAPSPSTTHTPAEPADRQLRQRRALRGRWLLWLLLLLAAGGGGAWLWHDVVRDLVVAKRFGVVVPGQLFRSGQISAGLVESTLQDHGIQVVVDLTNAVPGDPEQAAEVAACQRLNIEHDRYPLRGDGTGDIHQYALAIARLDKALHDGRPVLVHCSSGTQRTGGVLTMYGLLVKHQTPTELFPDLVRYGWSAQDNPQLVPYLNAHMAELAQLLTEQGVIKQAPDPLPVMPLNP